MDRPPSPALPRSASSAALGWQAPTLLVNPPQPPLQRRHALHSVVATLPNLLPLNVRFLTTFALLMLAYFVATLCFDGLVVSDTYILALISSALTATAIGAMPKRR